MKAEVFVTLKQEVLDPQGNAVQNALKGLGFGEVKAVRVGKFIELELDAKDAAEVEPRIRAMCEKVLFNPVIEDVRFSVK